MLPETLSGHNDPGPWNPVDVAHQSKPHALNDCRLQSASGMGYERHSLTFALNHMGLNDAFHGHQVVQNLLLCEHWRQLICAQIVS